MPPPHPPDRRVQDIGETVDGRLGDLLGIDISTPEGAEEFREHIRWLKQAKEDEAKRKARRRSLVLTLAGAIGTSLLAKGVEVFWVFSGSIAE